MLNLSRFISPSVKADILTFSCPGPFTIPGAEFERAGSSIAVAAPPVVLRPVRHPDVPTDQQIIDELGDIQILAQLIVIRGHSHVLRGQRALELIPTSGNATVFAAVTDGEVVFLFSAKVGGGKVRVRPLHRIVETPVDSVDVEVNEVTICPLMISMP